jgi:hypothetical protein
MNLISRSWVWSSHRGHYEEYGLLDCNAVEFGGSQKFRNNILQIMVMSSAAPGPNNDCAGEGQQKFTRTEPITVIHFRTSVTVSWWSGGPEKRVIPEVPLSNINNSKKCNYKRQRNCSTYWHLFTTVAMRRPRGRQIYQIRFWETAR